MFGTAQPSISYRLLLKGVMLSILLSSISSAPAAIDAPPKISIYLVNHGWHAGIVLERQYLSDRVEVLQQDFTHADYLEIGWGDSDFYQIPEPHIGHILKAGLFPSASVLHLVGFSGDVKRQFPYSEIVALKLTPKQLDQLGHYIAASFASNSEGKIESLGGGLYGDSRFYQSKESYHILNSCNVWTARGLKQAGLALYPASAVTVDDLMGQLRGLGKVIQPMKVIDESHLDNHDKRHD